MIVLNNSELNFVNAGVAMMKGNVFYVTESSTINVGGLKFTSSAICLNDVCSEDVFNSPTRYSMKNFTLNGHEDFLIHGEKITNGAVYYLNSI